MQILSDVVLISSNNEYKIESELLKKYGNVLRWAVVDVTDNGHYRVAVTYKYMQQ